MRDEDGDPFKSDVDRERLTAGLCADCVHGQRVVSARGSLFWLCRLSGRDPAFVRYPRLPVLRCPGYEPGGRGAMSMRSAVPVVALALAALSPGSPAEPSEWPLRVVTVAGQAEVNKSSASAWSAARIRAELDPGAAARTLQGRLTLRTASGQEVRLAPVSRITLREGGAADQPTRLRMDAGSVWAAVMPGSPPPEHLEVQTGAVTVTVRGSGVGITLGRDGSVVVRVYHGAAECAGPGGGRWTRTLGAGQELLVPSAGQPGQLRKLVRDKLDADWAQWNEQQDLAGGYGGKPPAR